MLLLNIGIRCDDALILCYHNYMKILDSKIAKQDLLSSEIVFDGPMIKAVVDVAKELIGIDANMHADIEQLLLGNGSEQSSLWGINLYPEDSDEDFIEFDSMINIRPRQNNRSRSVEDVAIQNKIREVVDKWIK